MCRAACIVHWKKNVYRDTLCRLQWQASHVTPDEIREEITNGIVYYMFYYVMQLQADIDPSLLWGTVDPINNGHNIDFT